MRQVRVAPEKEKADPNEAKGLWEAERGRYIATIEEVFFFHYRRHAAQLKNSKFLGLWSNPEGIHAQWPTLTLGEA